MATQNPKINDFCDACKVANAQQLYCGKADCNPKRIVVVQIVGGVAEIIKQPDDVTVQIVDYDNEK